jgi:hypothetical protein
MLSAMNESTTPEKVLTVSMAEEAGKTIRAAIRQWPQTLRLISLLVAATFPAALVALLAILLRH